MPKTTDRISSLGFGCMRFPTTAEGKIDRPQAMEMLTYAYKHGVNYFDTAYPYHNGESELVVGEFLQTIDRSKVLIATKLPCWLIKTPEDMDKYLNEQLSKLQTGYIDYYLLHALNHKTWAALKKMKVLKFLEKARADGRIRHIGFSFHDAYPVFRKIVMSYDWDFCQIMLNYLDTHYQAGKRGFEIAAERKMGIIAMEPLRGGKLVSPIPPGIEALWSKSSQQMSPVQRAVRWVWNLPDATVLLSGMSSLAQLKENIKYADAFSANELTPADLKLYQRVRREYIKRIPILCSECRYCLPCPQKVAIPSVMGVYNEAVMFDDKERHAKEYKWFVPEESRAGKCIQCGVCLAKCPQKIDIPNQMIKIADYFGE